MKEKADQVKEEEKKMSAVLDRVGREGSLEEITEASMKRGSEPRRYLGKSETGRKPVSAKALRCLEKSKECEGEFARNEMVGDEVGFVARVRIVWCL